MPEKRRKFDPEFREGAGGHSGVRAVLFLEVEHGPGLRELLRILASGPVPGELSGERRALEMFRAEAGPDRDRQRGSRENL